MTTHKNSSSTPTNIGSLSVEGVREWRNSIEHFFLKDWQAVSEIVLTLEKTIWENVQEKEVRVEQPAFVSTAQELGLTSVIRNDKASEPPPKSNDPKKNQRLEELAMKIEARLKTDDGQTTAEEP